MVNSFTMPLTVSKLLVVKQLIYSNSNNNPLAAMRLIRFPSHWTKTQLWLLLMGGGAKWSKTFGKSPNPSDPHAQIRDIWWVPPPPVDFWPPNLNPMSLPDALSNPSCRAFIIDLAFSSDTASVIKMGNVSRLFQTLTSSSHKDETVLIMYVLAHRFQYVLKSFGERIALEE